MKKPEVGDFITLQDYPKGLWLLYESGGEIHAFCLRGADGSIMCMPAGPWRKGIETSIVITDANLVSKVLLQIYGEGI